MSEEAKGPSDEAKLAVAKAIALIEGCDPQDRGYLLNRLSQIYFGAKSAKQVRGAVKNSKKSPKKAKLSWKQEWEATPEYREWQSHIAAHKGDTPAQRAGNQPTYEALRGRAFRVRDALKAARDNRGAEQEAEEEE